MEGSRLEEAELVGLARRGDIDAYEELVRRYEDVAFRTAYVITGNSSDAQEVAQDAFVKAHAALGRFRTDAPLRPWLLRIVANEARNRRRAAGRRQGLSLRLARDRGPDGAAPSPEEAFLAHERRGALLSAIDRLGEEDRLVITCRYLLELAEAETAATLNWPVGTVKSRLWRALGRLRAALPEERSL